MSEAWDSLNRFIENACAIIGALAMIVGFPFGLLWLLTTLDEMGYLAR
jgi:hypothetical protein